MENEIKVLPVNNTNGSGSLLAQATATAMGFVFVCCFNSANDITQPLTESISFSHSINVASNRESFEQIRDKNISIYENIDIPLQPLLEENLNTLHQISELEDNWDNEGAQSFEKDLIKKVVHLVETIRFQPQIFPTARDSIQLEYDKKNGDYLEFEIFKNSAKMFFCSHGGEHYEKDIDITLIGKMVADFYGTYI